MFRQELHELVEVLALLLRQSGDVLGARRETHRLLANVVIDVAYIFIDPRIRYSRRA